MTPPPRPPEPAAAAEAEDELVPVSVRLGTVVPPEDPEDWTQPLTWVAAAGMLAAPLVALLWFWLSPPAIGDADSPGTFLVAAAVALGGVADGRHAAGRTARLDRDRGGRLVRRPGRRCWSVY